MDSFSTLLGQRLRDAAEARGLSIASIAVNLGVSPASVSHYFNGRNELKYEKLLHFAELVDVPVQDLLNPPSDVVESFETVDPKSKDFVRIPVRNVELAAGAGAASNEEEVIGHLAFRADWLRANQISPKEASLVRVFGKSMEPTLKDGDMVLVDHRKIHPRGKEVYAMRLDDGTLVVKRLEVVMPELDLIVHSDNPEVLSWLVPVAKRPDNPIIGRVVWSARTWQL